MQVTAFLVVVTVVAGCRADEPLEKLAATDVRTFEPASATRPPPPPPPPVLRHLGPPSEIAALVRDGFGAPLVTLFELTTEDASAHAFLGHAVRKRIALDARESIRFAAALAADDAFTDGHNGCTCAPLGIRIARGRAAVDFTVDCGNVRLADGCDAGTLAERVNGYIDSLR